MIYNYLTKLAAGMAARQNHEQAIFMYLHRGFEEGVDTPDGVYTLNSRENPGEIQITVKEGHLVQALVWHGPRYEQGKRPGWLKEVPPQRTWEPKKK